MAKADQATRARAAGKQSIRARTIWTLEFSAGFAVRCLKGADGCELEARVSGKWEPFAIGETKTRDPVSLLRIVSSSDGLARMVVRAVQS